MFMRPAAIQLEVSDRGLRSHEQGGILGEIVGKALVDICDLNQSFSGNM